MRRLLRRRRSVSQYRPPSHSSGRPNRKHPTVKHRSAITKWALAALVGLSAGLSACNSDSSAKEIADVPNVAVTSFSLRKVVGNSALDSVYFAIDLDNKVIYNADSLPKGTEINKLQVNIKYSADVDKAIINMTGGTTRTGEVDYTKEANDSIDFTGDVTLTLGCNEGFEQTYRIKVNVHKQVPDSLSWDNVSIGKLPSRLGAPTAQKTVTHDEEAICLLRESDGTYTLSTTTEIENASWQKREIAFPFTPDVSSLSVTENGSLWILDTDGNLYQSTDRSAFTATGQRWTTLIGPYLNTVVGLEADGNTVRYAQYPLLELNAVEADPEFPRSESTNFVTLQNKWTLSPVAFFAGGVKADGHVSDDTWAFDGANWIKLCEGGIPALAGASIIPYFTYRQSASGGSQIEYRVWMLLGGRLDSGEFNRTVYISYDNGVTWQPGSKLLQLPDVIPAMSRFDNAVLTTPMSGNISDAWKLRWRAPKTRVDYEVSGETITWQCPYIYLIGGYDPNGHLYDTIWKGVLNRLTFVPII